MQYLNSDWEPSHGGQFELWDQDRCRQRMVPMLNRFTVFTVSDNAIHGHPSLVQNPSGKWRFAVQFQYYSATSAYAEERPTHR